MNGRVATALRAVARFDLGVDAPDAPLGTPLAVDEWSALLHEVRRERLVPVLDAAVRSGDLPTTREQSEALTTEAEGARRAVRDLDGLLVEVSSSLADAGVELRVLKGPAVARLDLRDATLRSYADVDLLVRGDQMEIALGVLAGHGFHRDLPERRPGFDRRFAKEVSLAHADGREIDVHRLLALGGIGTAIDLDALWARSERFTVGNSTLDALDAEGRFVHACINAALGDPKPRIVALRDAALIARAHPLDEVRVARLLAPLRGAAVIELVRTHVAAVLGASLHYPTVNAPPSRWERQVLRCYRAQGGSNTLELLSAVAGLSGWRARVAFLAALGVPARRYRKARTFGGRPREVTTAVAEVVSRRREAPAPVAAPVEVAPPTLLPSRRPGLGVVELDGETVVWDPASERVTRLDGTASLVWQHLDGTSTVAELVDDLAFAFDADRDVVDRDVSRLVRRLVSVGLAEWARMESWTASE